MRENAEKKVVIFMNDVPRMRAGLHKVVAKLHNLVDDVYVFGVGPKLRVKDFTVSFARIS